MSLVTSLTSNDLFKTAIFYEEIYFFVEQPARVNAIVITVLCLGWDSNVSVRNPASSTSVVYPK